MEPSRVKLIQINPHILKITKFSPRSFACFHQLQNSKLLFRFLEPILLTFQRYQKTLPPPPTPSPQQIAIRLMLDELWQLRQYSG